jgi:hypothetical protein
MPLSIDNLVQPAATGSFEGTTGTVTLPIATTAGSVVIICATAGGGTTPVLATNIPTGGAGTFERVNALGSGAADNRSSVSTYMQRNVAAGETSWTLTTDGASRQVVWAVMELAGAGLAPYVNWFLKSSDTMPTANALVGSATTLPVPTASAGTSECYETLGIQVFGATSSDTTVPVISGYGPGYSEVVQDHHTNASQSVSLAVAFCQILDVGNFTASAAVSPTAYVATDLALLYSDTGRFVPHYDLMFGAEIGTAVGLTNGVSNFRVFDGQVGTPEVVTTFRRSGDYSLKLSSTSAAEDVTWTAGNGLPVNKFKLSQRLNVYFDGSLPGVDVPLFSAEAGSLAAGMTVTYRTASQKIGVKVDSGTEVLSDAVVAASKWIGIDLRLDTLPNTHLCDWMVDYDSLDTVAPVAQAQASGSAGSPAALTAIRFGWTTAITATVYYDDLVGSMRYEMYPIGDNRLIPLRVDATGTPTVSGSSSNFKTFTANGTMSTWTAADTVARLRTVPPPVGASATGLAQVSTAASDYVEIPMETMTFAPLNCPRGGRVYFAGWAASTNPATLAFQVLDDAGNVLFTSGAARDWNYDNSTVQWTAWVLGSSGNVGYPWTQAHVDGLRVRVGLSDDALPDVGILLALIEFAYQPAEVVNVASGEADTFNLYARQDPITKAVASLALSTPAGTRGGAIYYALAGVDQTPQPVGPGTIGEVSIGAASSADVTSYGLGVDPSV